MNRNRVQIKKELDEAMEKVESLYKLNPSSGDAYESAVRLWLVWETRASRLQFEYSLPQEF